MLETNKRQVSPKKIYEKLSYQSNFEKQRDQVSRNEIILTTIVQIGQ